MVLAAALSSASMPWNAHGLTVKGAEVSLLPMGPLGPHQLIWTTRKYVVLSDDGTKTVAVFTADGYGGKAGWVLGFGFSSDVDKPFADDGNALADGEKILLACIDRFRSDVPSASIEAIDIDPRINGEYWAKFIRHMRAKILQMNDTLDSTNLRRIDNRAQAFIQTSDDLKALANRIAARLGCKVRGVNLQGDGIAIRQQFFGQPMSVAASQPDLGLWIGTAAISIFLAPK